jgi:5-methylthioadenosine/S-adenosylhomocysteine deaminase
LRFLSADWVLPIASPPIRQGVLVIDGEKIKAVLTRDAFFSRYRGSGQEKLEDFGKAIISPGLVNLHTHLDYSNLYLLDTRVDFFSWIQKLTKTAATWTPDQWQASALNGARLIAQSGTTCVADSSYSGQAALAAAELGLRAVVGLELFGIDESSAESQFEAWLNKYSKLTGQTAAGTKLATALVSGQIQITISPHAPYTVCPKLWSYAQSWACRENLPVLTHLAESKQECLWIKGHDEQIDHFLKAMITGGIPEELPWKGLGLTPVAHLQHHNLLQAVTIAAHTVCVDAADRQIMSRHKVKSVHCPVSNARLRNGIAPYAELLADGIEVGFGTDSLASNDSLDVLSEARFAWNLHRAVNPGFDLMPEVAIYQLTLGAAKILNLADKIGSLEAGKDADIAVFSLAEPLKSASNEPYEQLLYAKHEVKEVLVSGKSIQLDTDKDTSNRLLTAAAK